MKTRLSAPLRPLLSRPPSRNPSSRPGRGVAPLLPRPPRTLPATPELLPGDAVDAPPSAPDRSPGSSLPKLLTAAEVAAVFRRSERALRDWMRRGYLAPLRVGRSLYFREEEVRALLGGRLRQAILSTPRNRSGAAGPAPAGSAALGASRLAKTLK